METSFDESVRSTRTGSSQILLDGPLPSRRARTSRTTKLMVYFLAITTLFAIVSLILVHPHSLSTTSLSNQPEYVTHLMESFLRGPKTTGTSKSQKHETIPAQTTQRTSEAIRPTKTTNKATTASKSLSNSSSLAGLSCTRYGGPSDAEAAEMVYWKDIPLDSHHVSPFFRPDKTEYLTFEPDAGGWNNIRMALETVVGLAFAMGRTLVLPPEKRMYLLYQGKGHTGEAQRNEFSFGHFFHMEDIHKEHAGLDIISMEEFLLREGVTGHMVDRKTGQVSYPPQNRTNWNGERSHTALFEWLRTVSHIPLWRPDDCLAVFPSRPGPEAIERLRAMNASILQPPRPKWEDFVGKPPPVDAPTIDRLKENWAGRQSMCLYNEIMQASTVIHFPMDHKSDARLLVHFYAFLFFEDWNHDLWMKRFIRDHVRYVDEIQCAAARVVAAARKHARENDPEQNPDGVFDTIHVRRGDFQYKRTRVEVKEIYEQTKKIIPEKSTLFIATDERDKSFFQLLADHYDVVYLDTFQDVIGADVNTNYYGMIDQLVSSRGRYFFGCWFSTFTVSIQGLQHRRSNFLPREQFVSPDFLHSM